eukprot:scaffold10946_cov114-Isochrysis_galbana.AAC.5
MGGPFPCGGGRVQPIRRHAHLIGGCRALPLYRGAIRGAAPAAACLARAPDRSDRPRRTRTESANRLACRAPARDGLRRKEKGKSNWQARAAQARLQRPRQRSPARTLPRAWPSARVSAPQRWSPDPSPRAPSLPEAQTSRPPARK